MIVSKKLANAFGRTWHEICLAQYINSPKQLPFAVGTAEHEGFINQQQTLYKATIKKIFRPSATAPIFNVNLYAFTLINKYGTLTIAGGVLERISLHTFPYHTDIHILDSVGNVINTFQNVGNPKFIN